MDNALEIHAHYSKLFEAFAVLPVYDIKRELAFGPIEKYLKHAKYREYGEYLERLRNYLKNSCLEPEKQQIIADYLDKSEPLNRLDILYPECRVFLHERDRFDLKIRFYTLLNGPDADRAAQFWAMGSPNSSLFDKRSIEEVEQNARLVPDADTMGRLDVIKKCLSILDKWQNLPPTPALDLSKKYAPAPGKPTSPWPEPLPFDKILPSAAAAHYEAPAATAPPAVGPFAPLLLNYTLAELTALLTELSLIDTRTGREAPTATPGAWAGVIHALLNGEKPRLRGGSNRAIQRAFTETFGAKVSERTAQGDLGKSNSVAEQVKDRALSILNR